MKNPRRGVIYSLIISFASVVVIASAGILYTKHVDNLVHESNQQFCQAFAAIDEAYKDAKVTTPAGKRIADEFHKLRVKFEC